MSAANFAAFGEVEIFVEGLVFDGDLVAHCRSKRMRQENAVTIKYFFMRILIRMIKTIEGECV